MSLPTPSGLALSLILTLVLMHLSADMWRSSTANRRRREFAYCTLAGLSLVWAGGVVLTFLLWLANNPPPHDVTTAASFVGGMYALMMAIPLFWWRARVAGRRFADEMYTQHGVELDIAALRSEYGAALAAKIMARRNPEHHPDRTQRPLL